MENDKIQLVEKTELDVFLNQSSFDHAQRVAQALSKSDLIPKEYKNNIPNTLIALDVAYRIKASPLMVMQHLYIVHGKPSWSSTFLIAAINNCGRFSSLRFDVSGDGDEYGCVAWAKDKDGNKLDGPKVTIGMAKKEGWLQKNGSKWITMPELMMRYRAAAFFSRLYAPEITMGMQTVEEVQDVTGEVVETKIEKSELEIIREKIIETIDSYPNPDKSTWKTKCAKAQKDGKFDLEYAKEVAEQLNIKL